MLKRPKIKATYNAQSVLYHSFSHKFIEKNCLLFRPFRKPVRFFLMLILFDCLVFSEIAKSIVNSKTKICLIYDSKLIDASSYIHIQMNLGSNCIFVSGEKKTHKFNEGIWHKSQWLEEKNLQTLMDLLLCARWAKFCPLSSTTKL